MLSMSFNAIRRMIQMFHEQRKKITRDIRSKGKTDEFQCSRRQNTVSLYNQNLKQKASTWNQSLESLLCDKRGVDIFKQFLRSEFSEENLEFWVACEKFKKCKNKEVELQAQKIYRTFVALHSSKQINLDFETLALTVSNLKKPCRSTFDRAQKRVQALMENDSYPRFLESSVYKILISNENTCEL